MKKVEESLICSICNAKFTSKRSLTVHKKYHDKPIDSFDTERVGLEPFSSANLERKKLFECSFCKKVYGAERRMLQHKKQHTNRVHDCEYCNDSFETKSELNNHVMNLHKNELRTYDCDQCSLNFPLESMLKSHSVTHYPKNVKGGRDRKHRCEGCPMTFFNIYHLKRHMRTHTGERRKYTH